MIVAGSICRGLRDNLSEQALCDVACPSML